MGRVARTCISGIVALAAARPVWSVMNSRPVHLWGWAILVALVLAALILKLCRVPAVRSLSGKKPSTAGASKSSQSVLPLAARLYVMGVLAGGVVLLTLGGLYWESQSLIRFFSVLALAVPAATLKIRLPRMMGTITPAFILLLTTITQMSLPETVFLAAILGAVQLIWRAARRPSPAQLMFNPACMAISSALAWFVSRYLLTAWLGYSVLTVPLLSSLALYGCNTFLVAAVVALSESKPLSSMWQLCCFWSLPFYLVGAAVAGMMTAVSQAGSWVESLLVLPVAGLAYVQYRLQLGSVARRAQPETA